MAPPTSTPQELRQYHAKVLETRQVGGHFEYVIHVTSSAGDSWTVQKRYRDIRALHDKLSSGNWGVPLDFPEKRLFGLGKWFLGSQDAKFLAQRRAQLDRYLDCLLRPGDAARKPLAFPLRQFLGCSPDGQGPRHRSLTELPELLTIIARAAGTTATRELGAASRVDAAAVRGLLPHLAAETASVLVCGGSFGTSASLVERLDPRSGRREPLPAAHLPRSACAAASAGGSFFVIGGDRASLGTGSGQEEDWVERLNPAAGEWDRFAPAGAACVHAAAATAGGLIYIFGGLGKGGAMADARCFDPATRRWKHLPPMPTPRFECAAASAGGLLYVVGGASTSGTPLAAVESYNPRTGAWKRLQAMERARFGCAVTALHGQVYAVGGHGLGGVFADAERFDPTTGAWASLPPMPMSRHHCGAAGIGGRVFVLGGTHGLQDLDSVDCFDPETGRWEAAAPLSRPFGRCVAAAVSS